MNTTLIKTGLSLAVALSIGALSQPAEAFVINRTITGDPRIGNPDQLFVDLTIAAGASAGLAANEALFTVNINSPLHASARLDEFYFNLADTIKNLVSFVDFSPVSAVGNNTWEVYSPATNAAGSGSADFQFGVRKTTTGGPQAERSPDVTNSVDLVFKLISSGGALTLADFTNAPESSSNNAILGSGQVGAHLISLTVNNQTCPQGGCSDSGFVIGDVPTPALLPGLIGLGVAALRKKQGDTAEDA